ncbi:NAD-glutamate dehydrogenase domain-containing protein, partial [Pseudomonadota bacterium]
MSLAMTPAEERAMRNRALDKITKKATRHVAKTARDRTLAFIAKYYANVAVDELVTLDPETLSCLALHHMKTGRKRAPDEALVNIYNPGSGGNNCQLSHTVVEIVAPNKPFLVDSISAEINRRGFGVHLAIHPVINVRRTAKGAMSQVIDSADADQNSLAESYIHLQIDEQPEARFEEIRAGLWEVLDDVSLAVRDWRGMRGCVGDLIDEMETLTASVSLQNVTEVRDFLRWLHDDNFTFLGYREYEFSGTGTKARVKVTKNSGLGVLSDPTRIVFQEIRDMAKMPPEVRAFINRPELLMLMKTDMKSRVHRPVQMDAIGVKRLDARGRVIGQRVLVGLFTAGAYNKSARDIPLLRRKIQVTFDRAGMPASGHSGKALLNILETFPRDELFQISPDQLLETSLGVLRLQDRQKVSLFVRRDDFERFMSCLVYVPRERYTTDLRRKIQTVLEEGFAGTVTAHFAYLGEQPLARLHVVVKTTPGNIPKCDLVALEKKIADLARSWSDWLGGALIQANGEMEGMRLLDSYQDAFGRGYEDRFSPDETLSDINKIEMTYVFKRLGLHLYQLQAADDGPPLRFKIYHPAHAVALSDVLPMLEDLGLRVMEEVPYRVRPKEAPHKVVIHDFGLEPRYPIQGGGEELQSRFHQAFDRIWDGAMESDALNALIFTAGLNWREVTVLRAYTKYLRQAGITFSEAYMARTLIENSTVARTIVDLFKAKFEVCKKAEDRTKAMRRATRLRNKVFDLLEDVHSADQDRILRRYTNLVDATLRTNFHQVDTDGDPKAWLSFKLSSGDVEELPLPRPKVEIFVYSPEVEGDFGLEPRYPIQTGGKDQRIKR